MIALGVSQAIEGSATNGATVNCTISGLLMSTQTPPVATGYQVLSQGQLAGSTASIYNPGASATALLSYINLYNTSAGTSQTVNLYLEGAASANQIATISIPPNGWAEYDGSSWSVYTSTGVPSVAAGLINSSTYISGTVPISATTATNITSLSLSAGTWFITGTVYAALTTATLGHMDAWLGPTSASTTSSYVAGSCSMGDIAGGTEDNTVVLHTVQTLAATTTVYLEAYCSEASTAENISKEQSLAHTTGILAVKIG